MHRVFLAFGYIPILPPNNFGIYELLKESLYLIDEIKNLSEKELLRKTKDLFDDIIDEEFTNDKGNNIIVPLSGGIDSRLLLGALIERIDASKINTITYGVPNTYDYEIGQLVAKEAGTKHIQLNITSDMFVWDFDNLNELAKNINKPTWIFDAYVNKSLAKYFGEETSIWSGFYGDRLSGDHLYNSNSPNFEEHFSHFKRNNVVNKKIRLPNWVNSYLKNQVNKFNIDERIQNKYEQMDTYIRQECCIKPTLFVQGCRYVTPLFNSKLVNWFWNVPRESRSKKQPYFDLCLSKYPRLFNLPVKNKYGLLLNASRFKVHSKYIILGTHYYFHKYFPFLSFPTFPWYNYGDLNKQIREKNDLRLIVTELINSLEKRNLEGIPSPTKTLKKHLSKQSNDAFLVLFMSALELNLINNRFAEYSDLEIKFDI